MGLTICIANKFQVMLLVVAWEPHFGNQGPRQTREIDNPPFPPSPSSFASSSHLPCPFLFPPPLPVLGLLPISQSMME